MKARIKLQAVPGTDEVFLEIPEAILKASGLQENELVEIAPFVRTYRDNHVENLIMIRKARQ